MSTNVVRVVIAFLVGGMVFPLFGKIYEHFVFSQVEAMFPEYFIWIYICVLGIFLTIVVLSSMGIIKEMPSKFKLD